MMYSVLSITTRATPLSAVTMMWSLSFLRFSSAKCSDLVMFVCIGLLLKVLRMLHELLTTHCTNSTLIMDPFT